MPLYEFSCRCGHTTEELVKVGTEEFKCVKCESIMKKLISLSTFKLLGSGWAADNYSRKRNDIV